MPASDPDRDPFGERSAGRWRVRRQLLGGRFLFTSNSRRLLRLADSAYRGLLPQRLPWPAATFELELRLTPARTLRGAGTPPALRTFAGPGGLLGGIMNAGNFVLLAPSARSGLVVVSRDMLALEYHVRYELIEFAVFTLASRAQRLLSLHAACIGRAGRGLLLMGSSGAGKSTLALHCALQGLAFLSEDAAFLDTDHLLVTGVPNFVHVQPQSASLIENPAAAARIRRSPVIRRRSGVAKLEVDLRRLGCRLASGPLELAAVVFLSSRHAGASARLVPLRTGELLRRFMAAQPYATRLPGWRAFRQHIDRVQGFELHRGRYPSDSVVALNHILERHGLRRPL